MASKKPGGLGRGLAALMGEDALCSKESRETDRLLVAPKEIDLVIAKAGLLLAQALEKAFRVEG